MDDFEFMGGGDNPIDAQTHQQFNTSAPIGLDATGLGGSFDGGNQMAF